MKIFIILIITTLITSAEVYVTESKVQVDRCACAWFIIKFLDPEASFLFFEHGSTPPEGIGFDYYGADFFHKGPDCSFTAFIKKYPRKNKKEQQALIEINSLVNDVFAWRNGKNAPSTELRKKIDLIWHTHKNDQQTFTDTYSLFEQLFNTMKSE